MEATWKTYGNRRALRMWDDALKGRTDRGGWPTRDAAAPEEDG